MGQLASIEESVTSSDTVQTLAAADTLSGWRPPQTHWQQGAESRLLRLAHLPQDWDREGASAPSFEALKGAAFLIQQLIAVGAPQPFITATQEGGIQFEWSSPTWTVELEVLSEVCHSMCWMNRESGVTWEGPPDYSPENVDKLLRRISEERQRGETA